MSRRPLSSLQADLSKFVDGLSDEMRHVAGKAAKDAALDTAERDLGADRAFSGFNRRSARLNSGYDLTPTVVTLNHPPQASRRDTHFMAQKTFMDGDVLTAGDINTAPSGEGGVWTSWTPAVTQGVGVSTTNTRSRYARFGRLIIANFNLTATSAGTGGSGPTVSLPAPASSANSINGSGTIRDTATFNYGGSWDGVTTSTIAMVGDSRTTFVGGDPSFALANTDIISGLVTSAAAT